MFQVLFFVYTALVMGASSLHAASVAPVARPLQRYKYQCETQGLGKSCYDYAKLLWNQRNEDQRKLARKYLQRSCELKYKSACQAYRANAFKNLHLQKAPKICFKNSDWKNVELTPYEQGLLVTKIKAKSFWDHVGFLEGDYWTLFNEQNVNSKSAVQSVFNTGTRQFIFKVKRSGTSTTLVFSCH